MRSTLLLVVAASLLIAGTSAAMAAAPLPALPADADAIPEPRLTIVQFVIHVLEDFCQDVACP
jgi:hypothetical protein